MVNNLFIVREQHWLCNAFKIKHEMFCFNWKGGCDAQD